MDPVIKGNMAKAVFYSTPTRPNAVPLLAHSIPIIFCFTTKGIEGIRIDEYMEKQSPRNTKGTALTPHAL